MLLSSVMYMVKWCDDEKKKRDGIIELLDFIRRAKYELCENRKQSILFLEEQKERMRIWNLQEIRSSLCRMEYHMGEKAWAHYVGKQIKNIRYSEEEEFWMKEIGNGIFGKMIEENKELLGKCEVELQSLYQNRKQKEEEKRKLAIPMVLLSTIMLLIIMI